MPASDETKSGLKHILKWSETAQSCLTLCDPMDCSLQGSSVHGIFQARVLEWIAISFSRGSSQPRDRTRVSSTAGRRFTVWATREEYIYYIYQARKDPDAGKDWRQEEKGTIGWDGWMASPTQRAWVWASSGRWWRTGKPGMLEYMVSQRVDTAELLNNTIISQAPVSVPYTWESALLPNTVPGTERRLPETDLDLKYSNTSFIKC